VNNLNGRTIVQTLGLLIGILTIGTPALAQQNQIRISRSSQDELVEARAYPWSAIGKLNNGVGGSCTAFMISPNYALTAAHCLFFRSTGRYLPAESIHLVLGYENEQFRHHFRISAYYIPPSYEPLRPYETLANDWALLSLSTREQSPSVLPLSKHFDAQSKFEVMTAGYSHRTPYAMTADHHCRMLGRSHDGHFLFDSCIAPAGYSGAPVLVPTADKRFSIAGIHVANQLWQTHTIAIAIPVDDIWPKIEPCVQNQRCHFQVVSRGRDPTAEELLSGLPSLGYRKTIEISSNPLCNGHGANCKTTLIGP
jgi:protease YdgD